MKASTVFFWLLFLGFAWCVPAPGQDIGPATIPIHSFIETRDGTILVQDDAVRSRIRLGFDGLTGTSKNTNLPVEYPPGRLFHGCRSIEPWLRPLRRAASRLGLPFGWSHALPWGATARPAPT